MLCWIQIRTEGRPWHDSDVLLEKVPGGSDSVGAGIVLLEHVMLVTAKIGQDVKSKDLIGIPQNRDDINSTWANHTCICVTFTSSSLDPYSAIRRRNTEPTFLMRRGLFSIADSAIVDELWPFAAFAVCKNRTSSMTSTTVSALMGRCCVPVV